MMPSGSRSREARVAETKLHQPCARFLQRAFSCSSPSLPRLFGAKMSPGPSAWARLHTDHSFETVTVYYPWHPLSNVSVRVRRREQHRDGERVVCEAPDGRVCSLPSWMCRPESSQFSLGPPVIAVQALSDLRDILTVWHTSSNGE